MRRLGLIVLCLVTAACATKGAPSRPAAKKPPKAPAPVLQARPAVTFSQTDANDLGETVLSLTEASSGAMVLMFGTESRPVGPVQFQKTEFATVAAQLAGIAGCNVQECPNYFFLYAPGYENLLDVSLAGKLDPAFQSMTVSMGVGYDTPLFETFALLGRILHCTLVIDNIVGEARTGLCMLVGAPLQDTLEAALKSARVRPDIFQVDSTPEYVFISSLQNTSARENLANADALDAAQTAALDRPVDVVLPEAPEDPAKLPMRQGALPLHRVVESLSQQLGVPVAVEKGLEQLPVTPCVFSHVRVRTAMDLILRQWPVGEFGYEFKEGTILIGRRK